MPYKIMIILSLLFFVSGCNGSLKQNYEVIYKSEGKQTEQSDKKETEKYTIAVIPKVSGIPYFNAVEAGAMEAGEDLNVHVFYSGPLIADWKQQEKIIADYIEQGVDAIALSANDPEKLGNVLKQAKAKGIKVFTWDSDTNPLYRQYFVNSVDPEILGRHVMDTLSLRMNEKGEYAIITGTDNAATLKEWIKWMIIQQKENYPNMKLLEIAESNDDPQKAYMITKKIIVWS